MDKDRVPVDSMRLSSQRTDRVVQVKKLSGLNNGQIEKADLMENKSCEPPLPAALV